MSFVQRLHSNLWPLTVTLKSEKIGKVKEDMISIELSETNKLHFEKLPNLRSFSSGDIVEWLSLEHVILNNCPNLKKFGLGGIKESRLKTILENQPQVDIDTNILHLFELLGHFSTTSDYIIDNNIVLRKLINYIRPSHFTNLQQLSIKNCDRRVNEFLIILMKRSHKLEDITIEQCETLKYLFDLDALTHDEEGHDKYFTQIKRLILVELHQLKHIWSKDPVGIWGFENLQMVHIKSCYSLKNLFSASTAKKLNQLEELKLETCEMLGKVVGNSTVEIIRFPTLKKVEFRSLKSFICFYSHTLEFPHLKTLVITECPRLIQFTTGFVTINASDITNNNSFSKLNELKLDNCHRLVCVVSSNILQELSNLEKLIVSHCNALEIMFKIHDEISDSANLLQHLDELILIDLPQLTHVINKEVVRFCQSLQRLQVKQCKRLKWIPGSLMLTNIEILDCEALEKIMIIDKDEGIRGKITFSKLKSICFQNLTNLTTPFPFTSEFPSLEKLKITNCPILMTSDEDSNERKDLKESVSSNYFFPNSLSLEILKELYMKNQDVEKLWHDNCPSKSFCELEYLTLSNNKKLLNVISSYKMILRFNKLRKMTLDQCEVLTEVFNLEDEKPNNNVQDMLPQLEELTLSNLSSFTCIWNKEPQVSFFPNLTSLHIIHCDTLKSLFSISFTKNLKNLKLLKLCNCEKLEEVVSIDKQEDVPIIFPKMECLVLKDLPNLLSFCQQDGTFDFPNLQIVRARNIPSMQIFARGNLNTPLLKSVHITSVKKFWLGNLNKTLSYIHNNPGEFHFMDFFGSLS